MVKLVGNDNEMLLKLSAVSMGLSMAVAKLSAYQRDLLIDAKKEIDYFELLKQSYIDSYEEDKMYAEEFAGASAEVDRMDMEMILRDDF
ncbi:hypothetical protein VKA11_12725 [Bacillus paranthracis]|uniref:hypothetical protein n=1 Tax=Bacillus paranthracis TaxID=2026186 RepID=UPI003260F707